MARKDFILEMGWAADLRGADSTNAAKKAVSDAIHHASMYVREFVDSYDKIYVDVTVAVPRPETVKKEEVLAVLPVGQKSIQVIDGGMKMQYQAGSPDEVIIANAAVRVSLEM